MHILLCNDDGVLAAGIRELAEALAKKWRVTVIAPEIEQSAQSHAITIKDPIRLHTLTAADANPAYYAVTGTPTDCTKFALSYFLRDDMPDLVISGINNGFNLGSDALYSGTVSAAMEAGFYRVPALALSVEKYSTKRGTEIIPFVLDFIERIYITGAYRGLLNVNFPLTGDCTWEKVKVVQQGYQEYLDVIDARMDRRGRRYYWIGGELQFHEEAVPTDVGLIKKGYITVVPLQWQQHDLARLEEVKSLVQTAPK